MIHGINFKIKENEKVGVVGRTGSGKSTLTLGLLRILEVGVGGRIDLDGEELGKLGLHQIRQKTVMIPQDPTLFTGNFGAVLIKKIDYNFLYIFVVDKE